MKREMYFKRESEFQKSQVLHAYISQEAKRKKRKKKK